MAAVASERLLVLLLSLASLSLLAAPVAAQTPWQVCGDSGNYTANSTYPRNLARLAAALPRNASASPALFAKGSVGAVPDIAYALALCRGDAANATACGACVATAFQDAQQLCAFAKDAAVYYDACYLRFSNRNFLGDTASNGGELILMNEQNVSSPVGAFDAAVRGLLNAAGGYAANSSRLRHGGGGVRCRQPHHLRPRAVHAGHVAGRLPELPWGCFWTYTAVPQREAGRQSSRGPLQFQVRGLPVLHRRPVAAAAGTVVAAAGAASCAS